MTTPEGLYLEIATMLEPLSAPFKTLDTKFRAAVDHAYQAGWRDYEQKMIDQLSDIIKQTPIVFEGNSSITYVPLIADRDRTAPSAPPEVYP